MAELSIKELQDLLTGNLRNGNMQNVRDIQAEIDKKTGGADAPVAGAPKSQITLGGAGQTIDPSQARNEMASFGTGMVKGGLGLADLATFAGESAASLKLRGVGATINNPPPYGRVSGSKAVEALKGVAGYTDRVPETPSEKFMDTAGQFVGGGTPFSLVNAARLARHAPTGLSLLQRGANNTKNFAGDLTKYAVAPAIANDSVERLTGSPLAGMVASMMTPLGVNAAIGSRHLVNSTTTPTRRTNIATAEKEGFTFTQGQKTGSEFIKGIEGTKTPTLDNKLQLGELQAKNLGFNNAIPAPLAGGAVKGQLTHELLQGAEELYKRKLNYSTHSVSKGDDGAEIFTDLPAIVKPELKTELSGIAGDYFKAIGRDRNIDILTPYTKILNGAGKDGLTAKTLNTWYSIVSAASAKAKPAEAQYLNAFAKKIDEVIEQSVGDVRYKTLQDTRLNYKARISIDNLLKSGDLSDSLVSPDDLKGSLIDLYGAKNYNAGTMDEFGLKLKSIYEVLQSPKSVRDSKNWIERATFAGLYAVPFALSSGNTSALIAIAALGWASKPVARALTNSKAGQNIISNSGLPNPSTTINAHSERLRKDNDGAGALVPFGQGAIGGIK